jgi:hypothetical protein
MSYLPQQVGLARATNNVPYKQSFATTQGGSQPGFSDRKRYVQYNSAFSGNSTLVLSSAHRSLGTINNALFRLNKPIIAYAVSLKSLILPVTWPNLTRDINFSVTYTPGAQPYPGNMTVPIGNYSYNLYQGQVTYAEVSAQPIYVNKDDLVWFLLRFFEGAVDSITIDPINGSWTWVWNASITTVTSNDPDVLNFFKITTQTFNTWVSTGYVDLTGPRNLLINCPELHSESYFSVSSKNQSYICSVPINNEIGDVINHEPSLEVVNYFQNERPISQLSISITDADTGELVPLYLDYILELRFYITQPINQ